MSTETPTPDTPFFEHRGSVELQQLVAKVHVGPLAKLLFGCGGVIAALALYGFQQERLMALPYGEEFFNCTLFLVFLNRMGAALLAGVCAVWSGELLSPAAPAWKYASVSLSNVCSTSCQYEALKFVSFPVQMLGKSMKMMPVMGWGIMISGKKYTLGDWLIAASVTVGCALFLSGGDISAVRHGGAPIYGLLLMLLFLASDGFTSTYQERIFREHQVTTFNQMLYVNLFSGGVAAAMLAASGGFQESFAFAARHPEFWWDAALLTVSGSLGQWFIYSVIFWFDALVLAATMNARQLASILISIKYYGHPVSPWQCLGMTLAFSGLFYKTLQTTQARKKPLEEPARDRQV